jgi:hypothetical protein
MIKKIIRHKALKFCMHMFKKYINKHNIDGAIRWFGIAMLLSTEKERNEVTMHLNKEQDKLNKEAGK